MYHISFLSPFQSFDEAKAQITIKWGAQQCIEAYLILISSSVNVCDGAAGERPWRDPKGLGIEVSQEWGMDNLRAHRV